VRGNATAINATAINITAINVTAINITAINIKHTQFEASSVSCTLLTRGSKLYSNTDHQG
jgi:hypothetical protein